LVTYNRKHILLRPWNFFQFPRWTAINILPEYSRFWSSI
jgi:hypothetical protein